jgi:uncharacterized protein (DUF2164 family)
LTIFLIRILSVAISYTNSPVLVNFISSYMGLSYTNSPVLVNFISSYMGLSYTNSPVLVNFISSYMGLSYTNSPVLVNLLRIVWKYQRGNQKPYIEGQTTTWQRKDKKTNKDMQNITQNTKDRVTRT